MPATHQFRPLELAEKCEWSVMKNLRIILRWVVLAEACILATAIVLIKML